MVFGCAEITSTSLQLAGGDDSGNKKNLGNHRPVLYCHTHTFVALKYKAKIQQNIMKTYT